MAKNSVAEPGDIRIVKRRKYTLLGCVFYGDPFHSKAGWSTENEIGLLWQRFMGLYEKNKTKITRKAVNRHLGYEVHIQPGDYRATRKFYVFVGVEVETLVGMPFEMWGKTLPSSSYAVFTFRGKEIFRGGKYIWETWLPGSEEYEEAYPYFMEVYDKRRFNGLGKEESEIDYYVPIRRKRS
jgi:AraC family transcriptional regulator